jgi:putative endonuclease
MREYFVYILASRSRVLYVGVTNDLARRIWEHRNKEASGFTSQYNVTRLVHCETFPTARQAIAREKQLKGWRRDKKVALIESANPEWRDLADGWYDGRDASTLRSDSGQALRSA